MSRHDQLSKRLARFERRGEIYRRFCQKEMEALDGLFEAERKKIENNRDQAYQELESQELELKEKLTQAGKEFSQKKYLLERDLTLNKLEMDKVDEAVQQISKKYNLDINRINEEKVNLQVSFERQKGALNDLYEEKKRHLLIATAKVLQEWKISEEKLKKAKAQFEEELGNIEKERGGKISSLKDQAEHKKHGWEAALIVMKKELELLGQEKLSLQKKLSEIKIEKEKELENVRLSLVVAKEQLEVDKATLVEKAENDQKQCETELGTLKEKLTQSETDLQQHLLEKETQKKQLEEAFQKEEEMLKEAVKTESGKRDFEQKLFEQEKTKLEKEWNRLKEEYEKKKWTWDNQIRTLMMQKSVQEAEHDAERLRVDREARTMVRSLEAKRDELRQRLLDVKNRHESVLVQSQKENEHLNKRFVWRRDRLWSMWQNRLDVLKKERAVLNEQIEELRTKFSKEQNQMNETEKRESERGHDLHEFVIQMTEKNRGQKKQQEIQLELEKTRFLAQIKECELLVTDWMDRLKNTQEEIAKANTGFVAQMNFLDRWSREEEKETELFLHDLQNALAVFGGVMGEKGIEKAA